ncbi:interferon regulatory factor 10 isoform X2 [Brachyhypopomus gauderio]|uniref:interferon regulatory factor 10 isoform X2 n=1 Tax=Brachyhypopomus gauderio TaxID=698409 RepID=UPI0040416F7C
MDEKGKNLRLREWLIAQIDSGKYYGLSWENGEKTMFKIPWKHAAKQDYRQSEDAALFKAWAVYKGKYLEGRDKADPSAWKTRLRCALNKSTDFQEVPECSQLDISEPYKVYRIMEDTERPAETNVSHQGRTPKELQKVLSQDDVKFESNNKGQSNEIPVDIRLNLHTSYSAPGFESTSSVSVPLMPSVGQISDFRLQVCLFYRGLLVQKVISTSPEGCFILQGSTPVGSERIYGPCAAHKLFFPLVDATPLPPGVCQAMGCLLPHLEKDLHRHLQAGGPRPRYEIDLCFGEEFPDVTQPKNRKLITAQVVPLFAHELLLQLHLPEGEAK